MGSYQFLRPALLMASAYPMLLRDYCRERHIDFFDLSLQCIFCNADLTLLDCANFQDKCLSIITRDGNAFGACIRCLRLSAKIERERYTQCAVRCNILDTIAGKPIESLLMRCTFCYRVIPAEEKQECVALNREAYLVRGTWRTHCNRCRQENEGQ